MKVKYNISGKIFFGIFTGALLVFTLFSFVNYFYTKSILERLTNNIVEKSFRSAYNRVESQILPLISNARNTFFLINNTETDSSVLCNLMFSSNQNISEIFGSGILIDTKRNNKEISLYLPKNSKEINNNCFLMTFPVRTQYAREGIYNITIVGDTISFNFFYSDSLISVNLLYDLHLSFFVNALNKETNKLPSRHYLFNNRSEKIIGLNNAILYEGVNQESSDISKITEYLKTGKFGFFNDNHKKNNQAFYISKLRGTNLILASLMHTDEIIKRMRRFYIISFLVTIISFALLALVLQRIIIKQTRPLLELSKISRLLEKGKLHTEIPEYHNNIETEQLANTLRTVQGRMQKYVSSLHSTLKEKRALTKDISFAEKIQNDMLPSPDWAIANVPQIDIYCKMKPAKGVAGDFYDYFFVDDDNLFFVLGDVSGKSIPAALFMVKAITLLQIEARKGNDPGKIFTDVNEQLTFRNEEGMFVTGVCGIINIKTGEVNICDAGHHDPLTNFNSENFNYTALQKNLPLGILIGGKPYRFNTFNLVEGDTIILYSDGLPEASNIRGEMLGHGPVEKELIAAGKLDLAEISKKIWRLYNRFTEKAIGNDDISIFILKYLGDSDNIEINQ